MDSSGDLDPQPVALIGEAFIFFKQNVSGNESLPINGHTIFNTDTNKSVFSVQCNYSNIVNNKKNIQHCMQR